jgi:hypothetical protein
LVTLKFRVGMAALSALLILTPSTPARAGTPAADLSAEQLIARTVQRYATATRYRDSATIRTRIGAHESVLTATTEFKAPQQLEVVLRDERGERYAIRPANGAYLVSDRNGESTRARDDALFGGTGVTSGYSTMLPPLLLDAPSLSPLARLSAPSIRGLETLHGERCTHVEGTDDEGRRFAIWIGEKSHAIRRTLRVIDSGVPQPFENQLDYETVSFD